MTEQDELLVIPEAAEILGYTWQHTRLLVRQGKLPGVKKGRDWFIPKEAVTDYNIRKRNLPLLSFSTRRGRPSIGNLENNSEDKEAKSRDTTITKQQVSGISALEKVDWAFTNNVTSYCTHDFHPYPAKFIPQIPRYLIDALSQKGDTILDPFCGSGTTLVESLLLGRHAIGIDLNPLGVLITKVKTTPLSEKQISYIRNFLGKLEKDFTGLYTGNPSTDSTGSISIPIPLIPKLDFWFDAKAIREAALIKMHISRIHDKVVKDFLSVAFSAILVSISRQDSDTRYVRREKNFNSLDALKRFRSKVLHMTNRITELRNIQDLPSVSVFHHDSRDLSFINSASVNLVVTSPPYPNAYSYHLYHQYRMLWLDMDPLAFKKDEIGSHRKYSKKNNSETPETFIGEMRQCFANLYRVLVDNGRFCLVIGDSIVRGQVVNNSELLKKVAEQCGFQLEAEFHRPIDLRRKSFNPKIGKIKHEHILVFRR